MVILHKPVGVDGKGEYTAATKGCFDVINAATPLIIGEIKGMTIRGDAAFSIADFGTADAGTSLGLLTKMVQAMRAQEGQGDKECIINYEDQAQNEWKSVFNHALGANKAVDAHGQPVPTPYDLGNVFIQACGVGFHSQCYPSNSIDFAVCFTAMHWLSKHPQSLVGKSYMHSARSNEPPALEQAQAKEDWLRILSARSKELVTGGRFVSVNFCVTTDGYFLGQTDVGSSMWDSFQQAWTHLHEEGLINATELTAVSFPNYYRTTAEFVEGVSQTPGLRLVSATEKVIRCPYREQLLDGSRSMTGKEYADFFVPTTRTWSQSTFHQALDDGRSEGEKADILEKFWSNYKDQVARDPKSHGMDYAHCYLVVEKV